MRGRQLLEVPHPRGAPPSPRRSDETSARPVQPGRRPIRHSRSTSEGDRLARPRTQPMPPARTEEENILPLARELNERLTKAAPEVFEMLSALGRRLYFPKGILPQGAEAKQKAHRLNATIGIATENGAPMHLPSIAAHLVDVSPGEAFNYAPPAGQQKLREQWRDKMIAENPGLAGRSFGLPIVTSAITHGLMLAGDLFVDPGDVIVLPDKLWGPSGPPEE